MKNLQKILLTALVVAGFAAAGCVGYVDGGGGGYYHHEGWYDDGPWIGGGPRGYIGVDIHADRGRGGDRDRGGDHHR